MRALVIIPTLNEAESLEKTVRRLRAVCKDDVLIVDDSSADGTQQIAVKLAASLGGINLLERETSTGLGDAYRAGFEWALHRGYELVVEMDADGSHPAETLPTMLEISRKTGVALVLGSRWVGGGSVVGWGAIRTLISRTGNAYAKFVLGSGVNDLTAGFRVVRCDFLKRIGIRTLTASGYCFQIELANRIEKAGGEIIEHPIVFREREAGKSKMSSAIVLEALWLVTGWGFSRWFRLARPNA